jgi:hypothetical protein
MIVLMSGTSWAESYSVCGDESGLVFEQFYDSSDAVAYYDVNSVKGNPKGFRVYTKIIKKERPRFKNPKKTCVTQVYNIDCKEDTYLIKNSTTYYALRKIAYTPEKELNTIEEDTIPEALKNKFCR